MVKKGCGTVVLSVVTTGVLILAVYSVFYLRFLNERSSFEGNT
jgi:hypothetical protein